MLTLLEAKVVALLALGTLTLITGFSPFYIRRRIMHTLHNRQGKLVLTGCLCFGAGVLLSIVFLHLIPETEANLSYAMEEGYMPETHYPVAMVGICCGFFLVYLVEELAHSCVESMQQKEEEVIVVEVEVVEKGPTTVEEAKKLAQQQRQRSVSRNMISESRFSVSSNCSNFARASVLMAAGGGGGGVGNGLNSASQGDHTTHQYDPQNGKGFDNSAFQGEMENNVESRHNVHTIPHCHHESNHGVPVGMTKLGTVIVVAALSFHGIMEGLALGLGESPIDVWVLMAALSAHKVVLSFSLGMELLELDVSVKPYAASMIIFSLASPIGGAIGCLVMALTPQESPEGVLIPTALQALAAGTILYITFCEILQRERTKEEGGKVRLVTMALGFGVMAGLEAIGGGHDHGHGNEGGDITTQSTLALHHTSII
ncbi:hypothetical protein Pcinc_019992 [Petrolisthes cinctipes]|uniref:Zinc transporter ZIP1 n=1 Tax=Petrolisthes cinctipes TaxID=88211 RepID=A0AAE1FJ17_PETCI|nr:hypothetical protein Pcinc_019992 [Petrolisthes cinctipes]